MPASRNKHGTDRVRRAVSAIILSVFALSAGDAIIKLSSASFPIWQIYVLRSGLVIPVLLLALWKLRYSLSATALTRRWTLLRSALLVLMWVSYYTALPKVDLALAAAAYYTAPLMITLLSARLAGDRVNRAVQGGVVLGFAGVLVMLRPGSAPVNPYVLLPFVAALLYALAMVVTRARCSKEDSLVLALVLNLAFILAGATATLAGMLSIVPEELVSGNRFLFGSWTTMGMEQWSVMSALAVAMLVGSVAAAIAYQSGPAPVVATFDYMYLVFAGLWGFLFFHEVPGWLDMTGIAMILIGGVIAVTCRAA